MAEAVADALTDHGTSSSRPAPAPASRWPTSSRRSSTTSGSWSRPPPSRSSTSSSSATSRGWSRRSRAPTPRSTRRTPCSRAAPTTPASSASARACPTTSRAALVEVPQRRPLGKKVLELRAWAEQEAENDGSGERDRAPRHTDREWRQVSVSHRDCLGAARCPFGEECFVEGAREEAHRSHLIVTNHSLLAIDAIEGVPMIPDYDVVVVDEAHEVVARVTQAATDELLASDVDRASRRSRRYVESGDARLVRGRRPGRRRRRPRRGDRRVSAGQVRRGARDARRRAGAGPRRRARLPLGVPEGGRLRRARRRPHPGPRLGPGGLRHRRADGGPLRGRRALAERGR